MADVTFKLRVVKVDMRDRMAERFGPEEAGRRLEVVAQRVQPKSKKELEGQGGAGAAPFPGPSVDILEEVTLSVHDPDGKVSEAFKSGGVVRVTFTTEK